MSENVPNFVPNSCPQLQVSRETHACRTCGKSEPEVGFYRETSNNRRKPLCKRCWYLKVSEDRIKRVAAEKKALLEPIVANHAAARFLRLPRPPIHIDEVPP